LGRVLYYVPYFTPLHPGRVLTTFGFLSSLVEAFNAIGVTYIANKALPQRYIDVGHIMMKMSLILQVVVIACFVVLAGIFHYRCRRAGITTKKVWGPLVTLYVSMGLIFVRTIYRMVEHFDIAGVKPGSDPMQLTPLIRYEWFFWVFEGSLMLVNQVMWNVRHPRRYLPQDYRLYLAQDGVTELQGPRWKDKRGFLMSLIDPFGLIDIGKKQEPYWERNGFSLPGEAAREAPSGTPRP
jgi:hypothetical protein